MRHWCTCLRSIYILIFQIFIMFFSTNKFIALSETWWVVKGTRHLCVDIIYYIPSRISEETYHFAFLQDTYGESDKTGDAFQINVEQCTLKLKQINTVWSFNCCCQSFILSLLSYAPKRSIWIHFTEGAFSR